MARRWGAFSVAILSLIAVAALAVGFRWLLSDSQSPWRAVVPAVATVALVVITATYAWLTYRLVHLAQSGEGHRAALQEEGARTVLRALVKDSWVVASVAHKYPITLNDDFPDVIPGEEYLPTLRAFASAIESEAYVLPPHLSFKATKLTNELLKSVTSTLALVHSLRAESHAAAEADRPTTLTSAKGFYYASLRDDVQPDEWDELLSGKHVKEAIKLADRLAKDIRARFASDDG
jgi:hypothetical protein